MKSRRLLCGIGRGNGLFGPSKPRLTLYTVLARVLISCVKPVSWKHSIIVPLTHLTDPLIAGLIWGGLRSLMIVSNDHSNYLMSFADIRVS